MRKTSLATKTLLPIAILGVLLLVGSYTLIDWQFHKNLNAEALKKAQLLIEATSSAVETSSSEAQLQRIVASLAGLEGVDGVYVVSDKPDRVIASTKRLWYGEKLGFIKDELVKEALQESLHEVKTLYKRQGNMVYYSSPLYLSNLGNKGFYSGAVLVEMNCSERERAVHRTLCLVSSFSLGAFLVIILSTFVIIKLFVVKPVAQIASLVSSTQSGGREGRLKIEHADEIGDLTKSFNSLLDTILQNEDLLKASAKSEKAANQAKSEFLANMSHEIRTPLTSILGYTELALSDIHQQVECSKSLETIRHNGHSLLTIINDILDLSKIEAGKFTVDRVPFDLHRQLEDVYALMKVRERDGDNTLRLTVAGDLPDIVVSDPVRVRQILINLVGNALKFTRDGCVEIKASLEVGLVNVEIRDEGIGMTEEQVLSVFEAFNQADNSTSRKFGGTGLGLAISSRLAEMLGGEVAVESEMGKGSVFTMTFDPGDYQHAVLEDPSKTEGGDVSVESLKGNILLVEDNKTNRFMVKKILKKSQLEIDEAENGLEAYEKVIAANGAYDLVLMDMQMPIMSGYDATEKLRAEGQTLPIIALTANVMAEDRKKCLDAGCDDYTGKPIDKQDLFQKLDKYLSVKNVE